MMRRIKNALYMPVLAVIFLLSSTGCTARSPWSSYDVTELEKRAEPETEAGAENETNVTASAMTVVEETEAEQEPEVPDITQSEPERTDPGSAGIHEECLSLIDEIISRDVANGFPSAQLAVMRDGKLVYENAWGSVNSYYPDGTRKQDSPEVTNDTLYDLASVTKMFGVNYALQKLVTEGRINLDNKVSDYIGERFFEDVIEIPYEKGESVSLDTQREWKKSITLKDLITHQAGLPADPHYCHQYYDAIKQELSEEEINPLYIGDVSGEDKREAVISAMCRTPLLYEPGNRTLYSDVDFMLLGIIIEHITGEDLDTYLKENFCAPMGLKHITYEPIEHGFVPDDCAATELNGNTRDGVVYFDGIRTQTLQGEVHDENAYYCMDGVSGHAGLFANAADLARLADLMLTGRSGDTEYFSDEVIDMFTSAKTAYERNWGLGWWRQGDMQRTKYFGTKAGEATFGHQGWTGTLIMIDPEKKIVIAYLTNKINTPVANREANPNKFVGSSYLSASPGFVPEIIYTGLDDMDADVTEQLEGGHWLE